jgi:putative ABC transport system permease protein
VSLLEALKLALHQIRVQKLKSAFTLLGVMIGVMFLIAVVSIVEGMAKYVEEDFAGALIGTNTFTLRRFAAVGPQGRGRDVRDQLRSPPLMPLDAEVVRQVLPEGTRSAIVNESFLYATNANARPRQVQAVATEASYFDIKSFVIEQGRPFVEQEQRAGARVVVIGTEVADHFFKGLDPLGRELRIAGAPYTVVGVLEEQGSVFGFSLDRLAVVPLTTPVSRVLRPRGDIGSFIVEGDTPEEIGELMERAREALRPHRRLGPGEPDNFGLVTQDAAFAFIEQLKGRLIIFATALPAISLVVGAMVIMNIMLVAVAERTREIGVRKALGARRRDIMSQFLAEAATLSVFGAAIGIGLGLALAQLVAKFTPLPAAVAPWAIGVALLMGGGVGIAAGAYPASRASRLDPITALRQE